MAIGPNSVSLLETQRAYAATGSAQPHTVPHVRPPGPADVRDPLWRPLNPTRDPIWTMDDEPDGADPPREPYGFARR